LFYIASDSVFKHLFSVLSEKTKASKFISFLRLSRDSMADFLFYQKVKIITKTS
jgi:hypothetical protein